MVDRAPIIAYAYNLSVYPHVFNMVSIISRLDSPQQSRWVPDQLQDSSGLPTRPQIWASSAIISSHQGFSFHTWFRTCWMLRSPVGLGYRLQPRLVGVIKGVCTDVGSHDQRGYHPKRPQGQLRMGVPSLPPLSTCSRRYYRKPSRWKLKPKFGGRSQDCWREPGWS